MSSGLGYVALAAVILGAWRPAQAAAAALLFGFASSLATTFGLLKAGISPPLLLMAPYVVTIVVVAGVTVTGPGGGGRATRLVKPSIGEEWTSCALRACHRHLARPRGRG